MGSLVAGTVRLRAGRCRLIDESPPWSGEPLGHYAGTLREHEEGSMNRTSRTPMSLGRRGAVSALLGLVIASGVACIPEFGEVSGPVRHGTLTTSNGESYVYSSDGDLLRATAPDTNTYNGVREFFWRTNGAYVADQQACITWNTPTGSSGTDQIQPGLALRIAPSGPDGKGVKGITVNENIWSAAVWYVWVNVWDSTDTVQPYHGVQLFDLSPIVGMFWLEDGVVHSTLVHDPWHVCARTQGLTLTFKVWTGTNPEPAWDDPDHVFTTTLPEGWNHPGYSGGYVGHVRGGETAVFSGQTSAPLCLVPDMIDTAHCQELLSPTTTSTIEPVTTVPDPPVTSTLPSPTTTSPG